MSRIATTALIPAWNPATTSQNLERASTPSSVSASMSMSMSASRLGGLRQTGESQQGLGGLRRRGALRRPGGASSSTPDVRTASSAVPLAALKQAPKVSAAHYERREMPTDPQALARLRDDALLASYPYHRDQMALPDGWAPANDAAAAVRQTMGLKNAGVEAGPGAIVDRDSGLAAVLLHNRSTRELVVSFGGTTAGKKTGATLTERSRPGRNFMSTLSQWGANLYAGLGGTPKSYRQARTLLATVQDAVAKEAAFAGCTVRVVGHSKGGGEAMYAALSAATPVPVTAFCPAHLSDRLIKQLPAGNLARAKQLVQSFSPTGDPVAGMRGLLPGLHGVGVGHHFDGMTGSSAMHLHDQFHRHVLHHCDGLAGQR